MAPAGVMPIQQPITQDLSDSAQYLVSSRQVWNTTRGLIAAGLWAVYPELIFLGVRIAIENAMFIPMVWALWKTPKDISAGTKPRAILFTGYLTGLACWVNPSLQVLGLAIPVSWGFCGGLRGRAGIKRLSLFGAGVVLAIAPWTIRNYVRLDAFVPLRSAFAYNLWRGNHPGATGTVRTFQGINVDDALSPEYTEYIAAHLVPDEVKRDQFFAAEVKKFITEHPADYLRLTATRFYYYWWRDLTHPLTAKAWYFFPWVLLLIFASVGVVRVFPEWRRWSLWFLQIVGFTALFSLTIVVPRYRLPMYPALFLLAATGMDYLWRKYFPELSHHQKEEIS